MTNQDTIQVQIHILNSMMKHIRVDNKDIICYGDFMDGKELKEWEEEGFARLLHLHNGYAELDSGENLYAGYIYDMVTQNNILYENIYLDGASIQAASSSPFRDVIEKHSWVCYAIIDPYCLKGQPIVYTVHKSFMFKFKEIETKLWDKRLAVRDKRIELITAKSNSVLAEGRAVGIRNEIRMLEQDIDKYEQMIGE